jgi:arginase
MAAAAAIPLPYPDALVVEAATLADQSATMARGLPMRPLVLGGCCCAHVGAIRGLSTRYGRLAVVWLDAHGDLNTPETSPSGNDWGMPLRMAIDEGSVRTEDVALVGARALDPPEAAYVAEHGIDPGVVRAVDGADAVYVALDADVVAPGAIPCFMPEPGGPSAEEVLSVIGRAAACAHVAGMGITGLSAAAKPVQIAPFVAAAGL